MLAPSLVVALVAAGTYVDPGELFPVTDWVRASAVQVGTAVPLLQERCSSGKTAACVELAYILGSGTGVAADAEHASDLANRACEVDDVAAACALEGWLLHDSPGLLQDPWRSRVAYEKACRLGHAPACYQLGLARARGEAAPAADPEAGRKLFERACKGGYAPACRAKLPAVDRRAWKPQASNAPKPDETCGDPEACSKLGFRLTQEGAAADLARARRLFDYACDRGHPFACQMMGELRAHTDGGVDDTGQEVLAFERRACDLGSRLACAGISAMYADGMLVKKDPEQALRYAERSCQAREPFGCVLAGRALLLSEPRRGFRLLEWACNQGEERGCYWEAVAYKEGWGVGPNLSLACWVLSNHCERPSHFRKSGSTCMLLGRFLRESPESSDRARAGAAFDAACELGVKSGCEEAAKESSEASGKDLGEKVQDL